MREWLGRLLLPIARRSPLSPTTITVVGIILCLLAAVTLALAGSRPVLFLVAPVIALTGGLCDALDGLVARAQNRCTKWGDFVDHFGDRVSDGAMFAGWLVGSSVRPAIALPALFGILLVGYAGTQIEASFAARNHEDVGRGEFIAAMILLPLISWAWITGTIASNILTLTPPEWMAILVSLMTIQALTQRLMRARRLAREME